MSDSRRLRWRATGLGYEYVTDRDSHSGRERPAYIHRLTAVAHFGIDEVVGADIHHKNGIPWDNREENLEPRDPYEHRCSHIGQHSSSPDSVEAE